MNSWRMTWGVILLAACAGCGGLLESDRYTDGVWVRGDGSSYAGPAPLAVREVTCEEPAHEMVGDDGTLLVAFSLVVELEDGSRHPVAFETRGPVGGFAYDHGSFTTSSGATYAVSCGVGITGAGRVADVTVVAPGPVRYVTGVALP